MWRAHYITGQLRLATFALSPQQVLDHHRQSLESLKVGVQMIFVSPHIYLLGAELENLILALYLDSWPGSWRVVLQ